MRSSPLSFPPGPFRGGSRYNSYGAFLKEKFGCRVSKVVVDAGFSCPNRDGTVGIGGCAYCNNDAFRPATATSGDPVSRQVERGIAYLRQRYRAQKFIVYFQPFTNTFAPLEKLIPLYESAFADPDVIGIAIGTRPDCVEEDKIAWLENLARTHFVTVELGLESVHDQTLARINRGHDYECWRRALRRTRGRGIYLGAHLILGFPWENRAEVLGMAEAVSGIGLDFLKLHHLHVVRNTALGRQFLNEPFPLLSYEQYLDLLIEFLERLDPAVRLERLFGLTQEEQLLGPRWGKTKAEIQHGIEHSLAARATWQGRCYQAPH
jgi:radical SAM protein (TIGR01212 family)